MKNIADYSKYKCPFDHIEKECGHALMGPEGFEDTYGVWCACGFRGPALVLEPEQLRLERLTEISQPLAAGEGEWIAENERQPTSADADGNGQVWASDGGTAILVPWWHFESTRDPGDRYPYWMPTGLRKPMPPTENPAAKAKPDCPQCKGTGTLSAECGCVDTPPTED